MLTHNGDQSINQCAVWRAVSWVFQAKGMANFMDERNKARLTKHLGSRTRCWPVGDENVVQGAPVRSFSSLQIYARHTAEYRSAAETDICGFNRSWHEAQVRHFFDHIENGSNRIFLKAGELGESGQKFRSISERLIYIVPFWKLIEEAVCYGCALREGDVWAYQNPEI